MNVGLELVPVFVGDGQHIASSAGTRMGCAVQNLWLSVFVADEHVEGLSQVRALRLYLPDRFVIQKN